MLHRAAAEENWPPARIDGPGRHCRWMVSP